MKLISAAVMGFAVLGTSVEASAYEWSPWMVAFCTEEGADGYCDSWDQFYDEDMWVAENACTYGDVCNRYYVCTGGAYDEVHQIYMIMYGDTEGGAVNGSYWDYDGGSYSPGWNPNIDMEEPMPLWDNYWRFYESSDLHNNPDQYNYYDGERVFLVSHVVNVPLVGPKFFYAEIRVDDDC